VMDATFLNERLTATKALIVAYEDAALALGNGVQSYTLDTGQSKQTVVRADIGNINKVLDTLYNRYGTLELRLGGGSLIAQGPR
jgi:hypothetical protein